MFILATRAENLRDQPGRLGSNKPFVRIWQTSKSLHVRNSAQRVDHPLKRHTRRIGRLWNCPSIELGDYEHRRVGILKRRAHTSQDARFAASKRTE